MFVVFSRVAYLSLTVIVTVWVGKTLHKNGRAFVVDAFGGDERLADAVNHLLLVGFYLLNIGLAGWSVRCGERPTDLISAVEAVAAQLGWALVVLAGMHAVNILVLSAVRRWKLNAPREIVEFLD